MSAHDILERAIDRHGGEDCKRRLAAVRLSVEHLGGRIPRAKGLDRTHPHPGEVTVEPFARRLTFHDYPAPGGAITYDDGAVITATADGDTGSGADADAERVVHADYRATFRGLRKLRRWSPEDAAYFFGYAVSHYLSLPWSLRDVEIVGTGLTRHRDLLLDRIDVRHPPGGDTHSTKQSFYFAPDGLLLRHDYRADILGPVFTGAHDSDAYDESHGVPIATRRTVRARIGRRVLPIVVLESRFAILDVTL